jgi:Xaa-Pro aminopeptidase
MERPEKGLAELIRVHCLERNLDVVGYHSVAQAASGEHAKTFWPLAPKYGVGWGKILGKGEMVRMEMKASLHGYWSNAARILIMGDPSPGQKKAYENLVTLRETAVENMKPGIRCNQIFARVIEVAKKKGIGLIGDLGVGHGIGVSSFEPPYLNACDTTETKKDMVFVIDPVIYGPGKEIMRSKDTVHITNNGCEIIGWYKDWREPYLASTSYASGPG